MSELEVIRRELREIGIAAQAIRFDNFPPSPEGVAFDYRVPTGRFRATKFRVALSFQENAYPEYAPHFIHIRDLESSTLTPYLRHESGGWRWWTFSAPPGDFWDGLPPEQKTMKTFVHRHLARMWAQL